MTENKIEGIPSSFVPRSGDILEAAELLRACSSLLRQGFGLVEFARQRANFSITDKSFLDFAKRVDKVGHTFIAAVNALYKRANEIRKEEESGVS